MVLEYTDDPANAQEAQILKQQLSKVGIQANLKQDDQTSFVSTAIGGTFSIMLWRQHPGDDPDANYEWWDTGSILNFGKFNDPSCRPSSTRAGPRPTRRQAQADLREGEPAVRLAGLQRVGVLLGMDDRREEERPRTRRAAVARRWAVSRSSSTGVIRCSGSG